VEIIADVGEDGGGRVAIRHRVKVEDDRLESRFDPSRVADDDESPVEPSMNGDKYIVLAEEINPLGPPLDLYKNRIVR